MYNDTKIIVQKKTPKTKKLISILERIKILVKDNFYMGVIQEFEKLTKNQKKELSKDIKELGNFLVADGLLNDLQQVTSWNHIRLEDEIYLYAKLNFYINKTTEEVHGKLLNMKRFKTRDDYFKSVNKTKSN